MVKIRSILGLLLLLAVGLGGAKTVRADDLDDTMDAYMHSVRSGNTVGFLQCFSQNNSWRFVSYRAGTTNIVSTTSFTYEQTCDEINGQHGLYSGIFGGTNRYRYRERLARHPLATWNRTENTYRLPDTEGISFVQWVKEDGRWVIRSIGDDAP